MLQAMIDKISDVLPSRTNDIVLRDATGSDARFVFKLIKGAVKEEHFVRWPSFMNKFFFGRAIRHMLIPHHQWPRRIDPNPANDEVLFARLWIAMAGRKRVGFVSICEESPGSFEKSVELWMVVVVPERRNEGVGKLIIDLVVNTLIEQGPKRKIIARCLPASKVMFSMLRDRGFRVVGLAPDGSRLLELKPKRQK
jgi:ribosomal protein S18 acetylase RimI-like enzyme